MAHVRERLPKLPELQARLAALEARLGINWFEQRLTALEKRLGADPPSGDLGEHMMDGVLDGPGLAETRRCTRRLESLEEQCKTSLRNWPG